MPCDSSYLDPNARESELQHAAILLLHVNRTLGRPVPGTLVRAAKDVYCTADYVPELCGAMRRLTRREKTTLFNIKSVNGRDLYAWWETHKMADRKRK